MTSSPPFQRLRQRPEQTDFDLVEDQPTEDFEEEYKVADRERDDTDEAEDTGPLPDAGLGVDIDIDIDDFEAFNRELDQRLDEVRNESVGDEQQFEDLGVERVSLVERVMAEFDRASPASTDETEVTDSGSADDAVADDRVTLRSAGMAAGTISSPEIRRTAGTTARSGAAIDEAPSGEDMDAPRHDSRQVPPSPAPLGPPPAGGDTYRIAVPRKNVLPILLGLSGLLAGAGAFWQSYQQGNELKLLTADVVETARAVRQVTTASLAPMGVSADSASSVSTRLDEILGQLKTLESSAEAAASASQAIKALDERMARAEAAVENLTKLAAVGEPVATADKVAAKEPVATDRTPQTTPTLADKTGDRLVILDAPPTEDGSKVATASPVPAKPSEAKPAETPAAAAKATPPAASTAPKQKVAEPSPRKPLPKPGDGRWAVVIESLATESDAERRRAQLRPSGIEAEIQEAEVRGQTWYRVMLAGYESRDEAKAAAVDIQARGLGTPWLLLRK